MRNFKTHLTTCCLHGAVELTEMPVSPGSGVGFNTHAYHFRKRGQQWGTVSFFLQKQSSEGISSLPELWKNVNVHITVWTSCGSDFLRACREGMWPGDTQMPFSKITRRKLKDLRRIIHEHKLDRAVFTLENDWTGKSSNTFFFSFSHFSLFSFFFTG